jgi:type I restriction enzyme, S subunit
VAVSWSQHSAALFDGRRLDPEYFDPRNSVVADAISGYGSLPITHWVKDVYRGVQPDYDALGGSRVIKTAHVQRVELLEEPRESVDGRSASKGKIPKNALLITSTGVGSAGRTFFFTADEDLVADGHIAILPMKDGVSPADAAYVCAYLQSPAGRQQIMRLNRGSSRQIEIYPQDLRTLEIPTLPQGLREEIGEEWLSVTEDIRSSRTSVREAEGLVFERFGFSEKEPSISGPSTWSGRVSELVDARRLDPEYTAPVVQQLRNTLTEATSVSLHSVTKSIRQGVQPDGYVDDGPFRIVKTKDVRYPSLNLSTCERAARQDWSGALEQGDLLINMTGEGTLGRAGVVPEMDDVPTFAAVDVAVLRIDASKAIPEYIALVLNSWIGRRQSLALQTGSSGQQHFYPVHFHSLRVPLPTLENGDIDFEWQSKVISVADRRRTALIRAAESMARIDAIFAESLGVSVDLSTIPS